VGFESDDDEDDAAESHEGAKRDDMRTLFHGLSQTDDVDDEPSATAAAAAAGSSTTDAFSGRATQHRGPHSNARHVIGRGAAHDLAIEHVSVSITLIFSRLKDFVLTKGVYKLAVNTWQ